jgi:hypothetical protein
MNRILSEPKDVKCLAKIFRVSVQTVRNALRGDITSDLAKRIRKAALEQGCKERGGAI